MQLWCFDYVLCCACLHPGLGSETAGSAWGLQQTDASIYRQQKLCESHMETLLTAMRPAIQSATHLHMSYEDRPQPRTHRFPRQALLIDTYGVIQPNVHETECLAIMANSMLARLAPAMLGLCRMSLEGRISCKTLPAFISISQQLSQIEVQAGSVPLATLRALCRQFSHITHFVLVAQQTQSCSLPAQQLQPYQTMQQLPEQVTKHLHPTIDAGSQEQQEQLLQYVSARKLSSSDINITSLKQQQDLTQYVTEDLDCLGNASCLTRIDLNLRKGCDIIINWNILPSSLQELRCADYASMHHKGSEKSRRNLLRLVLPSFPCPNVGVLKAQFPMLQQLTVTGPSEVRIGLYLDDLVPFYAGQHRPLFRIFDGGFQLDCCSLRMEGDYRNIQKLLQIMPPCPSTMFLTVGLRDEQSHNFRLQDLSRVFTNVKRLTLVDHNVGFIKAELSAASIVNHLSRCTCLERLQLSVEINFTTQSLGTLCLNLPNLSFLSFFHVKQVDNHRLQARVLMSRSVFELHSSLFEDNDPFV